MHPAARPGPFRKPRMRLAAPGSLFRKSGVPLAASRGLFRKLGTDLTASGRPFRKPGTRLAAPARRFQKLGKGRSRRAQSVNRGKFRWRGYRPGRVKYWHDVQSSVRLPKPETRSAAIHRLHPLHLAHTIRRAGAIQKNLAPPKPAQINSPPPTQRRWKGANQNPAVTLRPMRAAQ